MGDERLPARREDVPVIIVLDVTRPMSAHGRSLAEKDVIGERSRSQSHCSAGSMRDAASYAHASPSVKSRYDPWFVRAS
jgi:hypothetical protein